MSPRPCICGTRKTRLHSLLAAAFVLPLLAGSATAGQLIYTPVNPSFGGNPLNGSYLLQQAQASKRYPLPMDDLDLANAIGIVAQTDNELIFKKGDSYYSYNINSGALHTIDFNNATGAGIDTGSLK